ncbi:MAG: FHA domain-containing protein, partial [Myxococcales bacterium]|nr:FHA domain-containing protein [Myxococcales bacterium]
MARHAKLAYQTPDGADRELLLDDTTPVTIGRHPDCSITVTQPSVSRRHARIWHEAGGFCVEDLNSSNGTYINNQRVTKATLSDGCELRCGDFLMRYTTTPDFDDVAPPPLPSNRPRVVGSIRPRRSDEPAVVSARPTTNRPDLQLPLGDGAPMLRPVGPSDPAPPASAIRCTWMRHGAATSQPCSATRMATCAAVTRSPPTTSRFPPTRCMQRSPRSAKPTRSPSIRTSSATYRSAPAHFSAAIIASPPCSRKRPTTSSMAARRKPTSSATAASASSS